MHTFSSLRQNYGSLKRRYNRLVECYSSRLASTSVFSNSSAAVLPISERTYSHKTRLQVLPTSNNSGRNIVANNGLLFSGLSWNLPVQQRTFFSGGLGGNCDRVALERINTRLQLAEKKKPFIHGLSRLHSQQTPSSFSSNTSRRAYGRKVFQDDEFDIYDNSAEDSMPDFPVTPEATWVFYQHIVKYFNEHAWEYHGLKDVVKGLLVDFRVHLEKVMMVKEEKEAQASMAHVLDGGKSPVLESDSDPEDINEIVKNHTPGKIIKAKLKDLVSDPEIERTVYANFLIEVAQRIPAVYKESVSLITDEDSKEFAKEQFGDLISCLELHIHSMVNLTFSPEIPTWTFEKYKVIAGPILYNYLLEAAVELGDGFVYGNLLRKMKEDHVGLNQYSFQLMMRFGEKAKKNNLIYAEELLKYMKEKDIEPDEETIATYERIKEKFSTVITEEPSVFESSSYNESLSGSNNNDVLPSVRRDFVREDITDQLDFQTNDSENLLRDALNSEKYKIKASDNFDDLSDVIPGLDFGDNAREDISLDKSVSALNFGDDDISNLFSEKKLSGLHFGDDKDVEVDEEFQSSISKLHFNDDASEGDDIIRKIVEGESDLNFGDDLPPLNDSFGSNMAQWYKQQRPHNHPSKKPVLPEYSMEDEEENQTKVDIFTKYKQSSQNLKKGDDIGSFKELGKVSPLSFKNFEDDMEDSGDWKIDDKDFTSKISLDDNDVSILKKFGLTPDELSSTFESSPGSKEDLEDVKDASHAYQAGLQSKALERDSVYAVKEKFYDTGFVDPYAQPIKGFDSSIANAFTEEDFYVEDPYKADGNRKVLKREDLISDVFDAYGEYDFETEMKQKAEILKKQQEKEKALEGTNDEGPDTWCDPKLKL